MFICSEAEQRIGIIRRSMIRCIIELEEGLFLIVRGTDGKDVVIRGEWDVYKGFIHIYESVPRKVIVFASKIIEYSVADGENYPLNGEWYSIKEHDYGDRKSWSLTKDKSPICTSLITICSWTLHLLVAGALAGLALTFTYDLAEAWMFVLFPQMGMRLVRTAVIVFELLGSGLLFLLFEDRCSVFSFYFNAFVPYGLITAAGAWVYLPWTRIALPIALCFCGLLAAVYIKLLEDRCLTCGECIRVTLILLSVILFFANVFGGLTVHVEADKTLESLEKDAEFAEMINWIVSCNLRQEEWVKLTEKEKLEVLQSICDYECKYVLGCGEVRVSFGKTDGENVLGEYHHRTDSITISLELIDCIDTETILNTLLHETRHAYQRALADMYSSIEQYVDEEYRSLMPLAQAGIFRDELANYCDSEDDFYGYYNQSIEIDSREWAEKRIEDYYFMIIYTNDSGRD